MKQFRWLSEETPHVYTDLGDVEKDKVGAALHKAVAGCSASLAKKMPQGREKDIGCVTCGRTESEQPNEIILCDGTGCMLRRVPCVVCGPDGGAGGRLVLLGVLKGSPALRDRRWGCESGRRCATVWHVVGRPSDWTRVRGGGRGLCWLLIKGAGAAPFNRRLT